MELFAVTLHSGGVKYKYFKFDKKYSPYMTC